MADHYPLFEFAMLIVYKKAISSFMLSRAYEKRAHATHY